MKATTAKAQFHVGKVVEDQCTKARLRIAMRDPFWGYLILGCDWIISRQVPTAATDGRTCYINPDFWQTLNAREQEGLIAHEVMHKMLTHITRAQALKLDPRLSNIAADYVGNEILLEAGFTLPQGALVDPVLTAKGGHTMEGVYRVLQKQGNGNGQGKGQGNGQPQQGNGQPGQPGQAGSDGLPNPLDEMLAPTDAKGQPMDEAELARETSEWLEQVAVAAQSAKRRGKLPAGLERVLDGVIKGKVRWQDVLAQFLTRSREDRRTWARPSRRYASMGVYLPSMTGESIGEIVVAVDCSGSIDKDMLARFTSEMQALHSSLRPRKMHVLSFDAKVHTHVEVTPDEQFTPRWQGGGGTAFAPIWAHVENHGIAPVCAVVLTDLDCSRWGDAPDYPVLWISTSNRDKAPFGEVVKA